MIEAWLKLLFPRDCFGCNTRLCGQAVLCQRCDEQLIPFPKHCKSCSKVIDDQEFCGQCLNKPSLIDEFISLYIYNDWVRQMVHQAKYHADIAILKWMATTMALHFNPQKQFDCVIPIAMSKKSLMHRGFNQTHYLAEKIAKRHSIPLDKNLLRKKSVAPQAQQKNHKQRYRNIKNAFSCRENRYNTVLLIDDVSTSGATLKSAAKVLKAAGVTSVTAYTFCATPLHS